MTPLSLRRSLAPTAFRRTAVQQAVTAALTQRPAATSASTFTNAASVSPVALKAEGAHHAVPPERVVAVLERITAALDGLAAAPLPMTRAELVERYVTLGQAQSSAEAALVTSLDALDTLGDPVAPSPFRELRNRAFQALSGVGAQYAKLDTSWSSLVHGGTGWPGQPIERAPDRGDGVPLRAYVNTFRSAVPLSYEQRAAEYQKRVDGFVAKGGSFESIIVAVPGVFAGLEPMFRYDYVVEEGGPMRLFPNGDDDDSKGPPKPGHSLLLEGSPTFRDVKAAMGGELWILKDSKGELEAVVLANNSGHLKPKYEDLVNVLPLLEALGVPLEKVVLFGGPNNLPAMFRELEEKFPDELKGLGARVPTMGEALAELRAAPTAAPNELWR